MRLLSVTQKYAGVIEVYDNAIETTAPLNYLKGNAHWEPARVGAGEGELKLSNRDNAVTFFNPFDFRCHDVLRNFASHVWHYLDDYATRHDVTFSSMENVNVNRYYTGERYKPHADDGPGHNRIVSALVYMNDVEGGETDFIYHGVSVSPRAGRLVIFPSNYAYAHAAHPPTSGVKYSAAFWTGK